MRTTLLAIAALIIAFPAMAQSGYIMNYPDGTSSYSIQHGSPLTNGYSEQGNMFTTGHTNGTTIYSNGMMCNTQQVVALCSR